MRLLAYIWAFPATLVGLLFIPLAAPWNHGRVRFVDGVLELHGRGISWCLRKLTLIDGGAAAMTFAHVVIGRDARSLTDSRQHERVHVRQYERWGIFFYPAYVLSSLWLWARGRDPYLDNPFEREAYGLDGKDPGR